MTKTKTIIGPEDQGQRMSLEQFDRATGVDGYIYELSKGVIDVMDGPNPSHFLVVQEIRRQLYRYMDNHPEQLDSVTSSNESKILLGEHESERHPDLSLYKTPAPSVKEVWSVWVPEIVVEVVSTRSATRDYEEKRQEYLDFGVMEYWIVDANKQRMLVLNRFGGTWREKNFKPTQKYITRLLPGLALDLKRVFAAARR